MEIFVAMVVLSPMIKPMKDKSSLVGCQMGAEFKLLMTANSTLASFIMADLRARAPNTTHTEESMKVNKKVDKGKARASSLMSMAISTRVASRMTKSMVWVISHLR